ncbi:hypothetical protein [Chondromyces crocatus]|uniref:Uncharacterized protein n=1 Tax=Chondromyces crocatus TaxID=52 RepID=A0A0K1EKS1_CHOCO|nr:hypothetical protein [Chondromyces crocatus]AKT41484.1 uncharacterized protein CMC5_056920 [Chondromyces crocatus]
MTRKQRHKGELSNERSPGRSWWKVPALGAGAFLLLFLVIKAVHRPAAAEPEPAATPAQRQPRETGDRPSPRAPRELPAEAPPPRKESAGDVVNDPRILWELRLERARHTLDSYLESTRYPPQSRPASENSDQMAPHHVDTVKLPLSRDDKKVTKAKVTLRQDRFFVVGDEQVRMTLACENDNRPAACSVASSVAGVPPEDRDRAPGGPQDVPVPFSNAGQEGLLTAVFQPSAQGFGGYHGSIRITVQVQVGSESGATSFDVQYTPAAPAMFTGAIREVLQNGSLDLFVGMKVDKPGRYVLTARADDAKGRSFAYLSYNDLLGQGPQEARLQLFGKLVRDEGAEPPFVIRDVEGYLLKESYPDRELMPLMAGPVHTTRRYAPSDFSESAWESEEKTRHVEEFTRDVENAEREVEAHTP